MQCTTRRLQATSLLRTPSQARGSERRARAYAPPRVARAASQVTMAASAERCAMAADLGSPRGGQPASWQSQSALGICLPTTTHRQSLLAGAPASSRAVCAHRSACDERRAAGAQPKRLATRAAHHAGEACAAASRSRRSPGAARRVGHAAVRGGSPRRGGGVGAQASRGALPRGEPVRPVAQRLGCIGLHGARAKTLPRARQVSTPAPAAQACRFAPGSA